MKVNLKWILRTLPNWLIILIFISFLFASLEGIANGMVLGQFPNLVSADSKKLAFFLIFAACLYGIVYTGILVEHLLLNYAQRKLKVALKSTMLTISFEQGEEVSKGLNHLSSDASKIENSYFDVISGICEGLIAAIVSTIYVLSVNSMMGLIFIAFSALSMLPMLFKQNKLALLGKQWSKANDNTMTEAASWLEGRSTIIQYGLMKTFFHRVRNAIVNSEKIMQKQNDTQWKVQYINWMLTVLALVGPWAVGFYFISTHQFNITMSILLTLTLSSNSVVQNIRILMQYWSEMASTQDIRKLSGIPKPLSDQKSDLDASSKIELKDVDLAYGDKKILDKVNFVFEKNKKYLLTGPSGVGKSSLLNLISGNMMPTNGEILLREKSPSPIDLLYISQDSWIFPGTVRENLSLDKEIPDEKLLKALEKVNLLNELGKNPLDRKVSPKDELSGGQKQRLAIARALLHLRGIVLLDEITASLDEKNSNEIRELFYQMPITIIESAHHVNKKLSKKYNFEVVTIKNKKLIEN